MDNDQTDSDLETGETPARVGGADRDVAMPETGGMDTTMAAGTRSGAAGVANAELGTSGTPAHDILTPDELAQLEVDGGAGLARGAVAGNDLADYFDGKNSQTDGA